MSDQKYFTFYNKAARKKMIELGEMHPLDEEAHELMGKLMQEGLSDEELSRLTCICEYLNLMELQSGIKRTKMN